MSSAAIELKFDRVSKTYHPGETVTGRYVRMRIMIKIIVNEDGDDDQIGDNVVMAMSFNPKTGQWTLQRSQRSNLKILMNFLLCTISFYTYFSFAFV